MLAMRTTEGSESRSTDATSRRTRLRSSGLRRASAGPLAALGLAAMSASPARAATAPDLADFDLRPGSLNAELQSRVADLDAQLPKLGVQNILAQASRHGTAMSGNGAICNPSAVDSKEPNIPVVYSFCWDPADAGASGGNIEWTPQGITTVTDAQDDQSWGTVQPLIVTWYNNDSESIKGVRVTFIDPWTGNYQHVLLVYPFVNASGNTSYMSVRTVQDSTPKSSSLHAGGVAWYGNYLYVADTARGFRVFDLRYIFDLQSAPNGDTSDKTKIGRQDGIFYGHGYRYVMPEVAAWTSALGELPSPIPPCTASGKPHFSFVGLDRTGTDHLNTGEYCDGTTGDLTGRVASWPLDGSTGAPSLSADGHWHATEAYRLPVSNVQGAVSHGATWYLSRSHGDAVPDQNDNSDLYRTTPGSSPTGVLGPPQRVPGAIGAEDLSYWSGFPSFGDAIFTLTEHAEVHPERMIYASPVSAFH